MAYLMQKEGQTAEAARAHVEACRPIVLPNGGFWTCLIEFGKELKGERTGVYAPAPKVCDARVSHSGHSLACRAFAKIPCVRSLSCCSQLKNSIEESEFELPPEWAAEPNHPKAALRVEKSGEAVDELPVNEHAMYARSTMWGDPPHGATHPMGDPSLRAPHETPPHGTPAYHPPYDGVASP